MVKSILLCDRSRPLRHGVRAGREPRVIPKAVQAALGAGWRRLHFASADEILAVTGCVQGAVTPIGLPDDVPVIFDKAIGRLAPATSAAAIRCAGLELAAGGFDAYGPRGRLAQIIAAVESIYLA